MKSRSVGLYLVGAITVVVTAGGVLWMSASRSAGVRTEATARASEVQAGPHVAVAVAKRGPAERRIELQGEARPFASVTLYAKVSGYLKTIRVDKGDRVRGGQLLAEIESPEVDRQYEGAVADAAYQKASAARAASLAGPGVVSRQESDLQASRATVAQSQVAALAAQRSYQTIRAPFDGVVTARYADPGALVQSAANGQTGALPVVTVAQPARLRIYAYVDQRDAPKVRVGDVADVTLPDRPGFVRRGEVTRLSSELDVKTRMMLVEVDLDNRDGQIVPGSFVTLTLTVRSEALVEIPVEALVLRERKPFVAVVGDASRVTYRPVVLAGDDGARVRISDGLREGERVALNLGNNVADGDLVQIVADGGPGAPARR